MRFIQTKFKNVLSFGGNEEFIVPYGSSTFNMVYGDNGVGKTNFTKLIEIGLYFEYPENVADIKNSYSSEDGFIEHTIESNGSIWIVKSVFTKKLKSVTVYKDNVLQDWGNPSTVQRKIDEYVVDIPYSIFKNILCSSIDNISSILKLNAKDSKEITNQIFDLSDINLVGEYTSKYHFSKNKNLSEKMVEKDTLQVSLDSQSKLFDDFKNNDMIEDEKKLKQLKEDLDKLQIRYDSAIVLKKSVNDSIRKMEKNVIERDIESVLVIMKSLEAEIFDLDKKIKTSENIISYINREKNKIDLDICMSKIDSDKKSLEIVLELKKEKENQLKNLSEIKDKKVINGLKLSYIENSNNLRHYKDIVESNTIKLLPIQESIAILEQNKKSAEKFSLYYPLLKTTSDKAKKIKKELHPDLLVVKGECDSLKDFRNKLDDKLRECKNSLSDLEKYVAFMENPKCSVKGCNMDFSSKENSELLSKSIIDLTNEKAKEREILADIETNINDLKTKEQNFAELQNTIQNLIGEVKSFVKDDSYDFVINFNDGVDTDLFKEKFGVVFSNEDEIKFQKLVVEADDIEKTIKENNIFIDVCEKNLFHISNTLSSSYDVKHIDDISYSDEEIVLMDNYNETTRDTIMSEYSEASKRYSDTESNILTLEYDSETLKDLISLNVCTDVDGLDPNLFDEYLESEKKNLSTYNEEMVKANRLEIENSTKLNILKENLKNYSDCVIEQNVEYDSETLNKQKNDCENDISEINDSMSSVKTNIENIENADNKQKYKIFDDAIDSIKKSINVIEKESAELHEEFKSAELLKELYNNNWLKNELIGQVVGGINGIIKEITDKYGMPVSCEFDSGFNSKLFKYGIETKYGQCSVGQRKMLQLISIIGVVYYYKQVYPKINFIFLDEALSSLTEVNTNKMITLINEYLVMKLGMTVFISHHSYLKASYFNNIYKLEEIKSVTKITMETDV